MIGALISVAIISLLSFVGVLSLVLRDKWLNRALILFVSFSAGSLMGGAFFHLLPESLAERGPLKVFCFLLLGFCLFFILERILRWHHCHEENCASQKHLGWINLFGDGLHNFLDGLIVVSAFLVSPALGAAVTFSIIFHEIPHEFGNFGVLLYSGFRKGQALLYNFVAALLSFLGVFIGYFLLRSRPNWDEFLLAIAAGGFIYIAAADLIPELHKEKKFWSAVSSFLFFLLALFLMLIIKVLSE